MKQRSIGFFAYAVITAVILSSCALILPELDIMSWSPGNDEPVNIDDLIISVEFSREPDHVLAEEAFSLTNQDGNTVNGRFSWEGSSLRLTPYSSLEANIEYSIKVETSVEDAYGGSLNEAFYKSFRTGSEGVRPVVEAVYPADRAVISSRNASVTVTFDRQMDFESVLKGFSISPDISGVSLLNDSGRVFSFTPAELWSLQQEYNIKISTDAASSVGYSIGSEYETSFTVSSDLTPPSVISVSTVDDATILADSIINTGWEKNSAIAVYFSEEVDQDSAESSVTLEPAASFDVDFDDSVTPARMIISFDDNLEWHTVYRLSISTALTDAADNAMEDSVVRRFFIDGASSMPPSVAKADFAPAGGSTVCF
ncbi:MAG TPA: hypothetical protein DCO79_15465 [Spirochaeta sp.]|nr:hypothetical protein [Spirochaeta sp.]